MLTKSCIKVHPSVDFLTRSDFSSFNKYLRMKGFLLGRANQLERYFRVVCGLDERFSEVVEVECRRLRSMADRLVLNSVVLHAEYLDLRQQCRLMPRTFEDYIISLFGFFTPWPDRRGCKGSLAAILYDCAARRSVYGRKAELISRVELEVSRRKDWFYVFNTLTVRPGREVDVFDRGSKVWQDYIRRVDRCLGRASFGSVRCAMAARARGDEFHQYVAVVERGGKHGRLHVHVVHFFKDLPRQCSDPNLGRSYADHFEISFWKRFWSDFGWSSPRPCRFSDSDAFARIGWKWPGQFVAGRFVSRQMGDTTRVVVGYVFKYVQKAYESEASLWRSQSGLRSCYVWRTRISRTMGMRIVRSVVSRLTMMQMQFLLRDRVFPRIQGVRIPRMMFRRMMLRKYLRRLIRFCPTVLITLVDRPVCPVSVLERFRALILNVGKFSRQSFGNIRIGAMRVMAVCKSLKAIFGELALPVQYSYDGLCGPSFAV